MAQFGSSGVHVIPEITYIQVKNEVTMKKDPFTSKDWWKHISQENVVAKKNVVCLIYNSFNNI